MTVGTGHAFVDSGIYQRLPCGCIMFALEVAPAGPCLLLIENEQPCKLPHQVADFLPMRYSRARALALERQL